MTDLRWRVEDLADETGISVDTIRFYQKRRLLPPPVREGRLAWYDPAHRERLLRIRELQSQGLSLALIGRLLEGDADARLAEAVAGRGAGAELSAAELATRGGVPEVMITVLAEAGLLSPTMVNGEPRYSIADAELVATGRALLDFGFPVEQLLALAQLQHQATLEVAQRAVEMFDVYVRQRIRGREGSADDQAEQMVAAFDVLFPAVTSLVSNHFGRVLLEQANAALEAERRPTHEERSA